MLRILIADDHDVVRGGIRELLEIRSDWTVCGEASNGREAVQMVSQLSPDVAILDISMPELNGIEATRRIKKESPSTEVIVFTLHEEERLIRDALVAGARGIVSKAGGGNQLVLAVDALSRHKPYLSPAASLILLDEFGRLRKAARSNHEEGGRLTPRESDVVRLLATGCGNREVSKVLGLSVTTVETHRASVMRKLHIHSIVDLVRYAIRNGLVDA